METLNPELLEEAVSLLKSLHDILLDLHEHPYPCVPNLLLCKKCASVALVLRVRPIYNHWPNSQHPLSLQDNTKGDPEALFIKQASRVGDCWTGYIALPGEKRDPEDTDNKATVIREISEKVELDLMIDNCIFIGNLPEHVISTVLCPYVFLLTCSDSPTLQLQPTEVASTYWISLNVLLSPSQRTVEYVDMSQRYAKTAGFITNLISCYMLGLMGFSAVRLRLTESLHCNVSPRFVNQDSQALSLLLQQFKMWFLPNQTSSNIQSRPFLLWIAIAATYDTVHANQMHNEVSVEGLGVGRYYRSSINRELECETHAIFLAWQAAIGSLALIYTWRLLRHCK
ncbi:hypothetical protein BDV23DRAFT_144418 [Aspergillus alliaceus]|uniref:Nudix hydrolase domain-containing protein n=1 Tax=Petromyces alliaceus TaxID=209559 RepID=A0A5N7CPD2_PETAA|nr:hypothetical protein BDV23DRAFT_144418 [Aspergillus alliaceus]